MKRLKLVALACLLALPVVGAENEQWLTNLPKAESKAKAEKKLVLMDFTGSDWCHPCMELRKNVLNSRKFEEYAQTNLVLMEVDFPIKKQQTEELKKANDALKDKFGIDGFPTIVLLDPDGKELLKTTDAALDTPKEFIARLEQAKKKAVQP